MVFLGQNYRTNLARVLRRRCHHGRADLLRPCWFHETCRNHCWMRNSGRSPLPNKTVLIMCNAQGTAGHGCAFDLRQQLEAIAGIGTRGVIAGGDVPPSQVLFCSMAGNLPGNVRAFLLVHGAHGPQQVAEQTVQPLHKRGDAVGHDDHEQPQKEEAHGNLDGKAKFHDGDLRRGSRHKS